MMIIVYNIQALSGCSADGSVLGSGPRGRGFKSRHSDHLKRSRNPYLSRVCGFFFFSNSRFWGLFGVYCFKKFIFSGFIFIKISELASSTNSKNNGTLATVYRLFLCLFCAVLFERQSVCNRFTRPCLRFLKAVGIYIQCRCYLAMSESCRNGLSVNAVDYKQ